MASVKNTRTNKYHITIDMDIDSSSLLLNKEQVPYPQSKSYYDEITIRKNKIEIIAHRSSAVDLNGVFINHQSALYRQITKSLVYYYCAAKEPTQIESIKIEHITKSSVNHVLLKRKDIKQAVSSKARLGALNDIDLDSLKLIFKENNRAHGFLFGLTYFIKSLHSDSQHGTFENQWKAFNAIYKAVSNFTRDFDCHRFIRKDIIENPNFYPLVLAKVSGLTEQSIRSNTRWIKFIQNDFPTAKQTSAFKDFLIRNEDHRLIKIFKETLTVREEFLKSQGFYNEVIEHINNNEEKVNNSHLAATLCLKYAYFARNKLIHAENIESGFRLVPLNKEEEEVTWLSGVLAQT